MYTKIKSFTLIEIIIVVIVTGVLATALITKVIGTQARARNVARVYMVNQLATAVKNYQADSNQYPSSIRFLESSYLSTIPIDPSRLNTCNTADTSQGEFGYMYYQNGGVDGMNEGFMIFSQVEQGGIGIDHGSVYLLSGANPCVDGDRYRVANSVCTSKPGRRNNNQAWTSVALTPVQQRTINILSPQSVWASIGGTGDNSKPWTNRKTNGNIKNQDNDGDGYKDGTTSPYEPNEAAKTNPCIPNVWANNCDLDTDEDGKFDSVEGQSTDSDGDGIPDYQESSEINNIGVDDPDGDTVANESDPDNLEPCIPATTNPGCDANTDDDTQGSDSGESGTADSDGDGIPNYLESNSSSTDRDGDGVPDEYDSDRPSCNGELATIYVSPLIEGKYYLIIMGQPQNIQEYNGVINAGNGGDVIVGSPGDDTISGGNGKDTICAGDGNDTLDGNNGKDEYSCGLGNDITIDSNGIDDCSADCEDTGGCNNTNQPITGITYPAPQNQSISCNQVSSGSTDVDGDSYLNDVDPNAYNYDRDDSNSCVPNSLAYNCNPKSSFVGGTCSDNDADGYATNLAHTLPNRDPEDQNPCTPNTGTAGCSVFNDNDSDGYYKSPSAYPGDVDYDPDDTNPCIPRAFGPNRDSCDADLDGKSNNSEGEFTNNDGFFRYSDDLAHNLYSGQYATIIDMMSGGFALVQIEHDSILNYLESDLIDSDGDGYNDEIDPDDANKCIPSNFGIGCYLDFDNDYIKDYIETNAGNADVTDNYPLGDQWPNWIESILANGLSIFGLNDPTGSAGDPDLDGYPNQIDPLNNDPCVPDTQSPACQQIFSPDEPDEPIATPVGGYIIHGVDCAQYQTLPLGFNAYYVVIY